MLSIISLSSSSRTPSSSPSPISILISSSVINVPGSTAFLPKILRVPLEIYRSNLINGDNMKHKPLKKPIVLRAIFSALSLANVFGISSPKVRIIKVITPVTPQAIFEVKTPPKIRIAIKDARTEAPILATLLPTRMVARKRLGSLAQRLMPLALSPSFSSKALILNFPSAVRAVSEAEKKAEKKSKIKRVITSKKVSPSEFPLLLHAFFSSFPDCYHHSR